ncbi:hypothetical protein DPEC_G00253940 [Dallia pectoralis]|uniref:Uncharacterized protein n=1 Tax=Dallia pectoralis TaxID=75939 RepID=A0ACC2FTS9_DALPE|nr:hypothetical protein DPEC_G00253940 [Dallia pectoralis]
MRLSYELEHETGIGPGEADPAQMFLDACVSSVALAVKSGGTEQSALWDSLSGCANSGGLRGAMAILLLCFSGPRAGDKGPSRVWGPASNRCAHSDD